jgi:hypothetical protein
MSFTAVIREGGKTAIEGEIPGIHRFYEALLQHAGYDHKSMSTAAAEGRRVSRCRTVQGAEEVSRRDEIDEQLALDQALAVGHVVELRGAVTELRDQVVAEIPVNDLKLVDEDAVDEQAALGAGVVALKAVMGWYVLGIEGRVGG